MSGTTLRKAPLVVKGTSMRDVVVAAVIGLALLAFVGWGILRMSHDVMPAPLLTGKILAKNFTPQPEEQMTVGKGGLDERDVDGIYTMEVKTADGHVCTVYAEKPIYEGHKVGDELTFLPPVRKGE
jgi:hypothetical protein